MKAGALLLATLGVASSVVLVSAAPASALPIETPYFTGTVPLINTYRYEPAAPDPVVPEFPNAALALASAGAIGAGVIIAKRRRSARIA
jgi:hypothetical protein